MIRSFCSIMNKVSDYMCILGAALISFLAGILAYDVIMRFVFNNPTSWVLDISELVQATIAFLVASYVLKVGGHVSMNMLTEFVSNAWRRRLFLVSNFIAMLGCAWMSYLSWSLFTKSYKIKEATYGLDLPLYPWKILVSVCFLLLTLQSLALFIETFLTPPDQFVAHRGEE